MNWIAKLIISLISDELEDIKARISVNEIAIGYLNERIEALESIYTLDDFDKRLLTIETEFDLHKRYHVPDTLNVRNDPNVSP